MVKKNLLSVVLVVLFMAVIGGSISTADEPRGTIQKEPTVTNVFFETDIREALRDVSAQVGINIIADNTVAGYVSLEVKDVPLEKCLQMMLAGGGYTFRKMDGYYLVGAPDPDNPSFDLLTTTEFIKLNYIKATDVPQLLSGFFSPYIQVNEATNTLTITSSPKIIARIKEDLAKIDRPPRQIMIEALVTDLSQEARKELGIDWSWTFNTDTGPFTESGGINYTDLIGSLSYATTAGFTREVLITLRRLIEEGKAKIRANPRVATLDGEEARIFIGKEEYYTIVTGPVTYPYTRLEMISVGITLKITPYIADTGEITVQIEPEVSDVVGKGAEELPVVSKRTVSTIVRVRDSETIVIGGLLSQREIERITRVPILSKIPGLGALFRSQTKSLEEKEVAIFITPHILTEAGKVSEKKTLTQEDNPRSQRPLGKIMTQADKAESKRPAGNKGGGLLLGLLLLGLIATTVH